MNTEQNLTKIDSLNGSIIADFTLTDEEFNILSKALELFRSGSNVIISRPNVKIECGPKQLLPSPDTLNDNCIDKCNEINIEKIAKALKDAGLKAIDMVPYRDDAESGYEIAYPGFFLRLHQIGCDIIKSYVGYTEKLQYPISIPALLNKIKTVIDFLPSPITPGNDGISH